MATSIKTPVGSAPVIPVVVIGVGMYLAWFAVHYFGSDTRWPTDPLKAVLQGKPLPAPTGQQSAAQIASEIASAPTQPPTVSGAPPPHSGSTYNLTDLGQLWTSQGGSLQTANAAAHVAMAESSGRADATSSNPDGGTNVGLWQLDTKGVGAGYTVAQLQDPALNARLTILHSANGTNWSSWANSVVKNGKYVGPSS